MTHSASHPLWDDLDPVERLEDRLTLLNERIARLAMGLNADLDSPENIARILSRQVPDLQQPSAAPSAVLPGLASSAQHRQHNAWEELRGLLALRCDIMTEALNRKGVNTTLGIAEDVENRLARDGFKPGADGFHLLDKLQKLEKTLGN
ncbi:MAG: hypothetical protein RLZZ352_2439 [Pseudomonadota bacterium]